MLFLRSTRPVLSLTVLSLSADGSDRGIGTIVDPVKKVGDTNRAAATAMKIIIESEAARGTAIARGIVTVSETVTERGNTAIVKTDRCVCYLLMYVGQFYYLFLIKLF